MRGQVKGPQEPELFCHRSHTYFLLLHTSKIFKNAQLQRKEDLCQKFIFVPAPAFIFFQSLLELKMKFLNIVLFQGSEGLAPQKPNNMHFSTVLPSSIKLRVCSPPPGWLVVVVRRKVL